MISYSDLLYLHYPRLYYSRECVDKLKCSTAIEELLS